MNHQKPSVLRILSLLLRLSLLEGILSKGFRVYTDLDDTAFATGYGSMKSSLSADVTKVQDRTYAGYESFLFHLATGGDPSQTNGIINVCTARPDIDTFKKPKEVFEDHINSLRGGSKRVFIDKVLYGDVLNAFSFELLGQHKYQQIKEDILQFKASGGEGVGHIFIGDNGQGDVLAGKLLLDEKVVEYVFIHVVVAEEPISTEGVGENMILFRNYDDAAVQASERGIFTALSEANVRSDYTKEVAKYTKLEKIIEGRSA